MHKIIKTSVRMVSQKTQAELSTMRKEYSIKSLDQKDLTEQELKNPWALFKHWVEDAQEKEIKNS